MSHIRSTTGLGWVPCAALLLLVTSGCGWDPGYPERTNSRPERSNSRPGTPAYRPSARPGSYIVRRGDTLYGIAFRYGLSHHNIASWNRLREPYTIYPGQRLRLTAPVRPVASSRSVQTKPPQANDTKSAAPPAASQPRRTAPRPAASNVVKKWIWPAEGKVVTQFVSADPNRKGIDIAGKAGQEIKAAADGRVVYSGNGLVGYGELVIIQHSDSLLSAYGHNRKRLVAEGENVTAGQRVAEMGATGSETTKLHFEIRVDGVPVDPRGYLPQR